MSADKGRAGSEPERIKRFSSSVTEADAAWASLANLTPARVALGRSGTSIPTREVLRFGLAHAQARDAVHAALDVAQLEAELHQAGWQSNSLHSRAESRAAYLARPDWGRRLSDESVRLLEKLDEQRMSENALPAEIVLVVSDGLSSAAVKNHAIPMLAEIRERLHEAVTSIPVFIAEQARVALADEVGGLLGASYVATLIGERPGLSSPDSLGIYFTAAPKPGRTDAERNCISNIHAAGLSYRQAAAQLAELHARASSAGGVTGVKLGATRLPHSP